jgi:hypothetical protein
MPLTFQTVDRGPVAFGFFNIESDMLLLENAFFFADAFCARVVDVARGEAARRSAWSVRVIDDPANIGDLMGAIRGVRLTGFVGETYRRYPFPERDEDFRQQPEGNRTQAEFLEMIEPVSEAREIPFEVDPDAEEVRLGEHRFTRTGFSELVDYVWRGGWPRWRDGIRPDYVVAMRAEIDRSDHWLFRDLELE